MRLAKCPTHSELDAMVDQEVIEETRRRLISLVRCANIKQALTEENPSPHLNFWRVIMGNMLDATVVDWCVLFGSDNERTHWKKIVPPNEHAGFRAGMLNKNNVSEQDWELFWESMKRYRDKHHVHMGARRQNDVYPSLELALGSSYFYFDWLRRKGFLIGAWPSLSEYSLEFRSLAGDVATVALQATKGISERVDGQFE